MSRLKSLMVLALIPLLAGCLSMEPKEHPLTADILIAAGEPLMSAALPKLGNDSALKRIADDGNRSTWISPDGITLTFEGGILVATRGLGHDLMGALAAPSLAAMAAPSDEVYRRQFGYLDSENHAYWLYGACKMARVGVDNGYTRFEESCQTPRNRFTNVYWRPLSGEIPLSQQWISEQIGMIHLGEYKNLSN